MPIPGLSAPCLSEALCPPPIFDGILQPVSLFVQQANNKSSTDKKWDSDKLNKFEEYFKKLLEKYKPKPPPKKEEKPPPPVRELPELSGTTPDVYSPVNITSSRLAISTVIMPADHELAEIPSAQVGTAQVSAAQAHDDAQAAPDLSAAEAHGNTERAAKVPSAQAYGDTERAAKVSSAPEI